METIPLNIGLKGQYKIEIKRNNTIIKETDWFDNLITDYGIKRIYRTNNFLDSNLTHCLIGTGGTAPKVSDTSLSVFFKKTSGSLNNSTTVGNNTNSIYRYVFPKGSVIGNITEVGCSDGVNSLVSRSLITDSNNEVLPLEVTDQDELIVYYNFITKHSSADGNPFTLLFNGVNHTVTLRRINKNNASSLDSAVNVFPKKVSSNILLGISGAYNKDKFNNTTNNPFVDIEDEHIYIGSNVIVTNKSFTDNSYTATITYPRDILNFTSGVRYIALALEDFRNYGSSKFNMCSKYYFEFDPPLMKTRSEELQFTYKVTWSRI